MMTLRTRIVSALGFAVICATLLGACGSDAGRRTPTAPSATMPPDATFSASRDNAPGQGAASDVSKSGASASTMDVLFPARDEAFLFRTALEAKYRDGLQRSAGPTYVDQEGTVVWTLEYLRYRVNLCSHAESVLRVFRQIDGFGIQPLCGNATTAVFPSRTEPLDFMVQLEAKYRDGLRRAPTQSFVDVEGNVIWTQEYLRYRVSTCSHITAQQKVFDQIDGRGVQADCTPPPPPPPPRPPTPAPAPSPSFVSLTLQSSQCGCVVGQIRVRANGTIVGSMRCPQTMTVSIQSGSTVTVCDDTGCWGGVFTMTSSRTMNLVCS
jgi:hypothetical protein